MKTIIRNTIALVSLTALIYGCDTGSKSTTKKSPGKKPDSTGTKSKLPPGESANSTTKKFRHSIIKMDTDLNFLRLQGEWVFATPFNKHDGLEDGPINPDNTKEPGGRLTLPAFPAINLEKSVAHGF